MIRSFFIWLSFLTRLPVPAARAGFDEDAYLRGVVITPLVGGVIGLILAGIYTAVSLSGEPLLAALAVTLGSVALTGGLHHDGLADTADGFGSGKSREDMLAVMKDSRIGTHGTLALVGAVLAQTALVMALPAARGAALVAAMPVAGRLAIPWCAGNARAARPGGLGANLIGSTGAGRMLAAAAVAALVAVPADPLPAGAGLAAAMFVSFIIARYSTRIIGGITGDVLGAAVVVAEIAYCTAAVAVTKIVP